MFPTMKRPSQLQVQSVSSTSSLSLRVNVPLRELAKMSKTFRRILVALGSQRASGGSVKGFAPKRAASPAVKEAACQIRLQGVRNRWYLDVVPEQFSRTEPDQQDSQCQSQVTPVAGSGTGASINNKKLVKSSDDGRSAKVDSRAEKDQPKLTTWRGTDSAQATSH